MKIEINEQKLEEAYKYWDEKQMVTEAAIEEMSELTKALCKRKRKPFADDSRAQVVEEIRDVYISLGLLMKDLMIKEGLMEIMIESKLSEEK